MKSHAMKIIGMITWAITALVAINVGLAVFSFDLFKTDFMMTSAAGIVKPLLIIILISGIISLLMFVSALAMGCDCGSCGSCKK